MATFNKFDSFVQALGTKVHKLDTDTLQVALCNAAHAPIAANTVLANLTQIAYTNLSTQVITTTSFTNSAGTSKLILADLILTASGAVAPFQYVVIFNQTASNDELIGWYNYGSEVTLALNDTFTIDFDNVNGAFTIT